MSHALARRSALVVIGAIVVVGVVADQVTKALAVQHLTEGVPRPLVGDVLQLALYRNSGAAFSTGTSLTVVFALAAMVALVAILAWVVPRVRSRVWAVIVGLGLAGIAGNFLDRLLRAPGPLRGQVVDFIALKFFAVFNVADIMLTTAAVLVVIVLVFVRVGFDGEPVDSGRTANPAPSSGAH